MFVMRRQVVNYYDETVGELYVPNKKMAIFTIAAQSSF